MNLTAGNSTSYGFGKGSGEAPTTGTCELTLADASYLASSTTLDPNGKYTINGDPTEDMIVVPELVYTGEALDVSGIKIDASKTSTGTYFNQTFTVKASAEGWTHTIDPSEVKAAGDYTVTFSKEGHTSISKTFTVAKSSTDLTSEGKVKTFNGSEETTSFTASDTITVKATPTPTGDAPAPANSAMFASSLAAPTAGQMAVFVGTTQVSEPVSAVDGTYTMTVPASEVLLAANGPKTGITLTAKFIENGNMAGAEGTATVNITAAAKAEKDNAVIGYYGESNLASAFTEENTGATVTLLTDVNFETYIALSSGNFTVNLNGKTIANPTYCVFFVSGSGHLTIRGNGKVIYTGTDGNYPQAITLRGGALTLEGGTFIGSRYGVLVDDNTSVLSVTGESVSIQGTVGGLRVAPARFAQLSAGTYSSISVGSSHTLASLLAENCAYYKGNTPILLSELAEQKELAGPVTVQECQHKDVTPTANNDGTHTLSCPYCGYTKAAENCDYGEYTHNDTSHTRICKLCGYQNVEAHKIKCTAEASGTVIAVSEACKTCSYGKDLGTVTIHIPKLVYGDLTGVVTAEETLTETVVVAANVNSPSGVTNIFSNDVIVDPPTMAKLTNGTLLSAGTHKMKIEIIIIRDDDNKLADCVLPFTVDPAPLTPSITGTAAKTYDGTTAVPAGLSITLEGKVGNDDVTATATGYAYDNANAGENKTVTASGITLEGGSKDNYTLSSTTVTTTGTISKADQATPAAPSAAEVTDNSITLNTITNGEYKVDGGEWQESPTFTGLDPNKAYTFYSRLKEDDNHNASPDSTGASITTKKTMLDGATVTVSGSYTYTGTAIVPAAGEVTVELNGTTIDSDQYTISATGNIDAGEATVTVTATADGNYSGSASTTFTISPATPTLAWESTIQELPYTGNPAAITAPKATGPNGIQLGITHDTGPCQFSYAKQGGSEFKGGLPTDAGIYTIKARVEAKGNYAAAESTNTLTLTISKSQPTIAFAEGYDPSKTYDGQTIPNPTADDLTITGATYADVTFDWSAEPMNAGAYTLTANIPETDNTAAASTTPLTVTISPKPVTSPAIALTPDTFVYDGTEKKPAVVVKDGNTIIPASEYTVGYSNNTNAGTATVTIANVAGNYDVSGSTTFTITAKPFAGASVSATGPFTYTGSALTPDPVVTLGGQTLVKDIDYTVAYAGNTNAGTATITVTGKGNYSGTAQGAFTIGKADLTVDGTGTAKGTYGDKLSALTVEGLTAKLNGNDVAGTWKLAGDTVPNVGDSGEYTATFTPATGAGNYNPLTAKVTLNIAKAAYSGTTTASTSGKFGMTKTYDLSNLLPAGYVLDTPTKTDNNGIFEGEPSVDGAVLTYKLVNDGQKKGQTGTITVPVTSTTNYNAFDLTITVTVTDKFVPTLAANPITITYTGEAVPDTAIKGTATVDGKNVPGTWSFAENQALTNVADSGTKTVKFVPTDKDNYAEATGTVVVTINKATPTGAPKYTAISASGKTLADVRLTTEGSNLKPTGTVAWALADTTEVTANTAYEWIFTPTDTANYTTLTGKITPWVQSTGGGGTYVPSGPSTPGSSTLPVTTTGQGSSNVTTTTTAAPTASTQGGTTTTTVNTTMGQEIVKQAVANKSEDVVIAPKITGSVTKAEVSIPASTVGQLGSQTNASLTVSTPVADVTIPNGGLGSLSSAGGAVTVTAQQTGNTVELTVTAGGKTVENVPGGVTLTVPTASATPGTVAVLVREDGTREVVRKSVADNGAVTIPLDGSAKLEIVDNSGTFADVPATSWAADAVAFASAHELFNGTAPGQFSPEAPMSRGMLAVVLHNLERNPAAVGGSFDDVNHQQWYGEAVTWAAEQGIVTGYGDGKFGPNDRITREQLAVILWRYAGQPTASQDLPFSDAEQASSWALAALGWATEQGILHGKNGDILDPGGFATRAETAQMLMQFLKK